MYHLTDAEKVLLGRLATLLENNSNYECLVTIRGGDRITNVIVLGINNPLNWHGVTESNLATFIKCGFISKQKLDSYFIHAGEILHAAKNNFEPANNQISHPTIHVMGSHNILNIQSTFNNSQQIINAAPLDEVFKQEFSSLLEQLRQELEANPSEASEAMAEIANEIAQEISQGKINKTKLAAKVEALKGIARNPNIMALSHQVCATLLTHGFMAAVG